MSMDLDTRIRQFAQMAEADPNNELGHFSLGKAYLEANRFEEAVASLQRVIEINPKMSKAYHVLGEACNGAGQRDKAIELMTRGIEVADELGDRMPRDAMISLLKEWGAPAPPLKSASSAAPSSREVGASKSGFACARCRKPSGQLPKPPFKGELGQKVFDNVCATCWGEWITTGTKVINELGLVLASPQGQQAYDQYMVEFLQLENT